MTIKVFNTWIATCSCGAQSRIGFSPVQDDWVAEQRGWTFSWQDPTNADISEYTGKLIRMFKRTADARGWNCGDPSNTHYQVPNKGVSKYATLAPQALR